MLAKNSPPFRESTRVYGRPWIQSAKSHIVYILNNYNISLLWVFSCGGKKFSTRHISLRNSKFVSHILLHTSLLSILEPRFSLVTAKDYFSQLGWHNNNNNNNNNTIRLFFLEYETKGVTNERQGVRAVSKLCEFPYESSARAFER